MSAKDEKALLYEKAQAAVQKTQRQAAPADGRTVSGGSGSGINNTAAAELYQQAMAGVNSNPNRNQPTLPYVSPLSGGTRKPPASTSNIPQHMTAEMEKAALKRYEEAKMAVERVHNSGYADPAGPAPIAYDSLYPKAGGSSATADAPPSFEASVSSAAAAALPMSALAEKAALAERMRANDVQSASNQIAAPPPSFNVATAVGTNTAQQYMDAAAEKEAVRKKLEERDARAAAAAARKKSASTQQAKQQQTSLRNGSVGSGARPTPTPPSNATPNKKVLTAAEEKALLQAKYEERDAKAQKKINGCTSHQNSSTTPPPSSSPQLPFQPQQNNTAPTPPPLMPRPPAEYIQETQEEDARVSKIAIDGASVKLDEGEDEVGGVGEVYINGNGNGHGGVVKAPGPPPPLPPKPVGE